MSFSHRWLAKLTTSRRRDVVLYIVISTLAYVFYLYKIASVPLLTPDSSGYLYFHQTRPVLYSSFIWVVRAITGSYTAVPPLQLLAFVACVLILAIRIRLYLSNGVIALLVLVFLLLDAPIILTTGSIVSDPMAATLIALFTAESLRYVGSNGKKAALTKSFLAGCAIAVRPINIVVSLGDAALVLFGPARSRATKLLAMAAVIGFAGLGLAVTPLVHDILYGSAEGGSPLARGLFQKAMYVTPVDEQAYIDCIGPEAFRIVQAGRLYVEQAPPQFRRQLMYRLSDYLRFAVLLPMIAHQTGVDAEWKADSKLDCYAAQAMKEHPLVILGRNLREYWALFSYEPFLSARGTQDFAAYLAAVPPPLPAAVQHPVEDVRIADRLRSDFAFLPPTAPSDGRFFHASTKTPDIVIDAVRVFVVAINASGVLALIGWLRVKDPTIGEKLLASAGLSLIANAGMAVTSNIEFALPRYQFVYWPATVTSAALLAWAALALWRRSRDRSV